MNIKSTWLTVNRNCNLSCQWCYAYEYTKTKNEMEIELAKKLIDISIEVGTKSLFLIGGEPTIYPYFFQILNYLIDRKIDIVVVTNGIMLGNDDFCDKIAKLPYDRLHFGISLKGASKKEYIQYCNTDAWQLVLHALDNCNKYNFSYSLSYVLTPENSEGLIAFAKSIKDSGIEKNISFVICNDIISSCGDVIKNSYHPLEIDRILSENYTDVGGILNDKISLHQTLPLCQVNKKMLDDLISKNKITTSCHVHRRNGLIFDTDGAILLCNNLPGFKLGEFGIDFCDAETLGSFWDSEYAMKLYNGFTSMPSEECQECSMSSLCGGGCCVQWFSNDFESYKNYNMKNLAR